MTKTFISKISIAAFVIAMFGLSASQANAQGILRDILNRMDAHYKSLSSLQAGITMQKTDVVLNETDTYTGSMSLLPKTAKRAQYARLDWVKPSEEHLVVIGDSYQMWKVSTNQLYVGKTDKAKNSGSAGSAFAFLGMSKAELQANYQVNYLGQESAAGANTWHLELIPKKQDKYKSAELWVDPNGMPLQAKIIAPNNDITTLVLSNIQKNVTISSQVFNLKLPANVKKIQA
jgi:outer membrane lipoprotein-sorting protein